MTPRFIATPIFVNVVLACASLAIAAPADVTDSVPATDITGGEFHFDWNAVVPADRVLMAALAETVTTPAPETGGRLRTWEMPPVTVVGESGSGLFEEQRVGSYAQPRWTATRRFPTTRVYVIPEGKVEVEGWMRTTFEEDGSTSIRALQEVEIGLPGRFQVDLYLRQDYDSESDETLWGGQFELRWALADWGKIFGNPTLYFEYLTLEERPDKIEPKLLLGGEIDQGWHWAVNLVAELELSGELEHEYEITAGLSYAVIDSKLALGVETTISFIDTKDDRGNYETPVLVGPSIQWRPIEPLTINFSPLFGVTDDSPDAQLWLNIGWEF